MRRVVVVLATMALAILLAGGVAQAVINGEPDRGPEAHRFVGALVTVPPSGEFKGQRIPVCSGTLISPRVFLTAGHCTEFLIKEDLPTYVSFDPTYKPGESKVIKASPYTHPGFCIPTPFVGDQQTIVGVTFGPVYPVPVCRGPVYYHRVDLPRVIKWVGSFP